ncbi:MAG: RNA polymerase sigma-70 factor [Saprospiraceae bacterium]|nr:RNA polymerase sigma-70 factor [Saprospiraceae bacterium]MCC7504578.1 RNA polymerase sigma-70 factor [Saprospiraceae bacterium]
MEPLPDISATPDPLEQSWLDAMRRGDESALRRIFDRHYPLLLADVYRLVPDESTCQDIAQDVFVELWRKRAELDIRISLRGYLRRSAVNRALNHIKTRKRLLLESPDESTQHAEDTSGWEIDRKTSQENLETALHAAIENLPEKCRLVFSLSRFEQLSHKQIADQLGISVKTIENQITKAIKLLREAMTRHADLSPAVIWLLKWWTGE